MFIELTPEVLYNLNPGIYAFLKKGAAYSTPEVYTLNSKNEFYGHLYGLVGVLKPQDILYEYNYVEELKQFTDEYLYSIKITQICNVEQQLNQLSEKFEYLTEYTSELLSLSKLFDNSIEFEDGNYNISATTPCIVFKKYEGKGSCTLRVKLFESGLYTYNETDYGGGSRSFSIFDTKIESIENLESVIEKFKESTSVWELAYPSKIVEKEKHGFIDFVLNLFKRLVQKQKNYD